MVRVGTVALLVLVCCAWAASAAAAKQSAKPTSTAGLSARVSLPSGAAVQSSLVPGHMTGAAQAAGINTSIGAGQYVGGIDLQSASTTFTMPSFSCAYGNDQEWMLPGLWVFDSSGFLVDQVDVNFNCNFGGTYQSDVICIEGGSCSTNIAPNPGDVIEVVYIQDSAANFAIGEVLDRTQGTIDTASGTATTGSVVLTGDMGPSYFGVNAVPTFSKNNFSISTLNGFYLSDWGPARLNLQTSSDVQIKSGAVKTTSFDTSWVHNY